MTTPTGQPWMTDPVGVVTYQAVTLVTDQPCYLVGAINSMASARRAGTVEVAGTAVIN